MNAVFMGDFFKASKLMAQITAFALSDMMTSLVIDTRTHIAIVPKDNIVSVVKANLLFQSMNEDNSYETIEKLELLYKGMQSDLFLFYHDYCKMEEEIQKEIDKDIWDVESYAKHNPEFANSKHFKKLKQAKKMFAEGVSLEEIAKTVFAEEVGAVNDILAKFIGKKSAENAEIEKDEENFDDLLTEDEII